MLFEIFKGQCTTHPAYELKERHHFELKVELDDEDAEIVWFAAKLKEGAEYKIGFKTAKHSVNPNNLGVDTLEVELDLVAKPITDPAPAPGSPPLPSAEQVLQTSGITGLKLGASATLKSVKIVLRPSLPDGSWSTQAPFFSLLACWVLNGTAAAKNSFIGNEGEIVTDVNATATVTACAGFACINPPNFEFSIDDLLIRFDLESFAFGTGWLPIRLIDISGLSLYHLNGFGRWFVELVKFPNLDFDGIELPDWTLDLPRSINLPLGLRVKESELSLKKIADDYVVTGRLQGLELYWQKDRIIDLSNFRAVVQYDLDTNKYQIDIRLVKDYYPKLDADIELPYDFTLLPLDALSLSAKCWHIRVGLHSGSNENDIGNNKLGEVCIDFLLEVGGLAISSSLTSDNEKPLFSTDLRLHMRNFSILVASPKMEFEPGIFFNDPAVSETKPGVKKVFADYVALYKTSEIAKKKHFSFATDLQSKKPANEDEHPPNDYGMEFIDGDFRKDERIYVAWSQVGTRFLDALSHDLFATKPAGRLPEDAKKTYLGLEISWFAGINPEDGKSRDDIQVRLDWLDGQSKLQRVKPEDEAQWKAIPDTDPARYAINSIDKSIPLPHRDEDSEVSGVALIPFTPQSEPISLQLPGVHFEFARPNARSIVLRREGGEDSVSYVFLYDKPEERKDPEDPADPEEAKQLSYPAQVGRAQIGFALTDEDNGTREVMSNDGETIEPFLTLGAGHSFNSATAVRIFGWKKGEGLRFADTLSADAVQPQRLAVTAPPTKPGWNNGCPPPATPSQPVVPMRYGDFATPDMNVEGWQYSFKIGADALGRVMNLFGGGENSAPAKLSIKRVIYEEESHHVLIEASIKLNLKSLGDVIGDDKTISGALTFRFDPADGALSIEDAATLRITQTRDTPSGWSETLPLPELAKDKNGKLTQQRVWAKPISFLGLKGHLYTDFDKDDVPKESDAQLELLTLTINKGRLSVGLAKTANMVIRYDGFGEDALYFLVEEFDLGPGGLTIKAGLILSQLRVRGLKAPFVLEMARLEIVNDELELLTVAASGTLPKLLDEAPVSLTATLKQRERGKIELDELICELGSKDEPIFSRGTRFKFEISCLDLRYVGDDSERTFFFEITGSAQFTPSEGEFTDGLLENLKSVRCEFVKAPLSDEFVDELSIMVELNEPVSFNMFNLFRMEIRSFGFEPHFDEFAEPGPAIVIGGQCEFAAFGDVISAEIDFHACRIGQASSGNPLPQIHFDGLRVDISSPEGFRIAGMVKRYDGDLIRGFAGEGTVGIPGFPELSAAFSFVRLRRDAASPWKHAWFVAVEAAKISVQIPSLPIYLRQVGLGFGYRYTLPLIKTFEDPNIESLADLIERMLQALDSHQTLARVESWVPDPEQNNRSAPWTVALEGVFTVGSSQKGLYDYKAKDEQKLKTLVAQIIAAIRSDFTLVAAAKIWFPVSVDDFFLNTEGMRDRPLARGFMIYSAPQKRFLAHASKHDNPYLGKPNDPWPEQVHALFKNSHFEATLLIEPGLLHAELGWPDRLMYRWTIGSLAIEVRAGALMRIENDAIVQGLFLSARGGMTLSGGLDWGFVGVRLIARVDVYFATRLMTALYLSRPLDSKIYAEIGLDLSVRFSVQAWLRIKIGFVKIKFDISFSFTLQIVVGLQLGWNGIGDLGFRGRATLVIGVFGRSLRAGIAVGINERAVNAARAAMLPYMSSFLAPGEPPRVPDGNLLNDRESIVEAESIPVSKFSTLSTDAGSPSISTSKESEFEAEIVADELAFESAKVADPIPDEDRLVLTQVPGRHNGELVTFVWVMPGPNEKAFYPLRREAFADPADPADPADEADVSEWEPYASLVTPEPVYLFDDHKKGWKKAEKKSTKLSTRQKKLTAYVDENGKTVEGGLNFHQLLAGCYTLDEKEKEAWYDELKDAGVDNPSFPEDYNQKAPLVVPFDPLMKNRLEDTRLRSGSSNQLNPKRELDPDDPFDRALMEAIDIAEERRKKPAQAMTDQALGMQSFLLQSFYDDLLLLAEGEIEQVVENKSRPTILDLGLVFMVEGTPEWLLRRQAGQNNVQLTFEASYAHPKEQHAIPHNDLLPVVDFTRLNFAQHPPVFNDPVTFQDEEVLAVGWRLGWGGGQPDMAEGSDPNPESFLKCYHVRIVDGVTRQTLLQRTSIPADLAGAKNKKDKGDDGKTIRICPRYQITVPLTELFGKNLPSGQLLRLLIVTVTPEDNSGGLGESFSFTPRLEPTLNPLPADEAECILKIDHSGAYSAELKWIQPTLPNRPGVAGTDGWDLVLRPLRQVPMGAFPEEAADPEDRGLMSATGQTLLDGDLVVDLESLGIGSDKTDYTLKLRPVSSSDELDNAEVKDLMGNDVVAGHPSHGAWVAFKQGLTGAHPDGRAWRLFLRARQVWDANDINQNAGGNSTVRYSYSGLTPLRLRAALAVDEIERKATKGNIQNGDVIKDAMVDPEAVPLRERPLPHFEWPENRDQSSIVVARPRAQGGALHIPVPTNDGELNYLQAPTRERVITVDWPALDEINRPSYAASAHYDLYATDIDRLVNADLSSSVVQNPDANRNELEAHGFGAQWQKVARLLPADRRTTGETPDNMTDAQNWLSYTPTFAATRRWQQHFNIADVDATEFWPGWYSWTDSHLRWPEPLDIVADHLAQMQDRSELSPAEINALQAKGMGARLASWFALGRLEAGDGVHPLLALIIGWIAGQRMAQLRNGSSTRTEVDQIEVSAGEPVQGLDPVSWLSSNNVGVDPVGWNALGHLGLGRTVIIRDSLTGLTRDQDHIQARIDAALSAINDLLEVLPEAANAARNAIESVLDSWGELHHGVKPGFVDQVTNVFAISSDAEKELRLLEGKHIDEVTSERTKNALTKAQQDYRSLMGSKDDSRIGAYQQLSEYIQTLTNQLYFDKPLKATWARRAGPQSPALADAALRMLHISLRPEPIIVTKPLSVSIVDAGYVEGELKNTTRITWRNRARAAETFASGQTLEEILRIGDLIFAVVELDLINVPRENEISIWPDAWINNGAYAKGVVEHAVPLPLNSKTEPDKNLPHTSPFGAFALDSERWIPHWPTQFNGEDKTYSEEHQQFERALTYILRSFTINAELDADKAQELADALLARDTNEHPEDGKLPVPTVIKPFLTWSTRFFTSAPIAMPAVQQEKNPTWLQTLAPKTGVSVPKTVDPLRLSADSDGRISITLPVEEQWATTRSYAVVATDRYARLRNSMKLKPSEAAMPARLLSRQARYEMMLPSNRADVQLPRVRKLEPPQALGSEITLIDEVPHQLISVARHTEDWLRNAAIPLRRKIEFGSTTRAYERKTLDRIRQWSDQLYALSWINVEPGLPFSDKAASGKSRVQTYERPDFDLVRRKHLAKIPKLRLSGDAYVTAADPFWYQSFVILGAHAGNVQSRLKKTALSIAPPSHTFALDENPVQISAYLADWKLLSKFGEAIDSRIQQWQSHRLPMLMEEDGKTKNVDYWLPQSWLIRVRLPRLIESLPEGSERDDGFYHGEFQDDTFGLLPDPDISLQVIREEMGSLVSLLRASPDTNAQSTVPITITMLDDRLKAIDTLMKDGSNTKWNLGIWLQLPITTKDAAVDTDLSPPESVTDTLADAPVMEFQAVGALRQLMPLALRLHRPEGERLHYTDPFFGPAWLCLPHLLPPDVTNMSQASLETGMKFVLDKYRRHAASWLCSDMQQLSDEEKSTDVVSNLLRLVGTSYISHLARPIEGLDLIQYDIKELDEDYSIKLAIREKNAGADSWQVLSDNTLPDDELRVLLMMFELMRGDDESDDEYQQRLDDQLAWFSGLWKKIDKASTSDVENALAEVAKVKTAASKLSMQGYRPAKSSQPTVYLQRGNQPRQLWQMRAKNRVVEEQEAGE